MISSLKGTVIFKNPRAATLEVGGLGYQVHFLSETLEALSVGQEVFCFTYLAVRENSLDLYGFLNQEEFDFFILLLGLTGIGPKSALATLSLAPPKTIRQAVISADAGYLAKVSGLGKKSAEKIVLGLKDKLGADEEFQTKNTNEENDILDALLAIGFSSREAREAIKNTSTDIVDINDRIKEAIKILSSKKWK